MTSTTTPLRARTRRLLAAAATTGVTVAALVGLAPAAQAAGYSVGYTGGDGVALRSAPAAGARLSPMVIWRDGTPVTIICQTWSQDGVGPRANHIFNRVAYRCHQESRREHALSSGSLAFRRGSPGLTDTGSGVAPG